MVGALGSVSGGGDSTGFSSVPGDQCLAQGYARVLILGDSEELP